MSMLGTFIVQSFSSASSTSSRPSTLRKAHDSILDPKYGGHRTSRRQLMDQEEDEDMDSDISEEQDNQPAHADEHHEADEENEEQSPPPRRATEQDDDLQSTLKRTRDHDRQKGLAVTQQLVCSMLFSMI